MDPPLVTRFDAMPREYGNFIFYVLVFVQGKIRTLPPMISLAEAAKVSVKYNVEPPKRKRPGGGTSSEEAPGSFLTRVRVPLKPIENLPKPVPSLQGLREPNVTQIFPTEDLTSETKSDLQRSGRLFLKRSSAVKRDNHMTSHSNVRLPVLPKKVKMEQKRSAAEENNAPFHTSNDDKNGNDAMKPLPLVHGASATFQSVLR